MRRKVAKIRGFRKQCDVMSLRGLFHFGDKFHIGTMNQSVLRNEFVKLVKGNKNYSEPP